MINRIATTSRYRIEHSVNQTSRISDYDYDPVRPDRRFYSTFMHTLRFSDNITDTELFRIGFPSDVWASLVSSIYKITYGSSQNPNNVLLTIKGVTLNDYPSVNIDTIIYRDAYYPDLISMTFSCGTPTWKFDFNMDDMEKFISILEIDEIEDLYIMYSTDRF